MQLNLENSVLSVPSTEQKLCLKPLGEVTAILSLPFSVPSMDGIRFKQNPSSMLEVFAFARQEGLIET